MEQHIANGKALGLEGTELRAFVEKETERLERETERLRLESESEKAEARQRLVEEREESRRQCEREIAERERVAEREREREREIAERDREERASLHELEMRRLDVSARHEENEGRRRSEASSMGDEIGGQFRSTGGFPRLPLGCRNFATAPTIWIHS